MNRECARSQIEPSLPRTGDRLCRLYFGSFRLLRRAAHLMELAPEAALRRAVVMLWASDSPVAVRVKTSGSRQAVPDGFCAGTLRLALGAHEVRSGRLSIEPAHTGIPMVRLESRCSSWSSTYAGFSSQPTKHLPRSVATCAVVPEPMNGSNTVSPGLEPARMHGSINSRGNVAECAPRKGFVVIVQTVRLLRFSRYVRAVIACLAVNSLRPLFAISALLGR